MYVRKARTPKNRPVAGTGRKGSGAARDNSEQFTNIQEDASFDLCSICIKQKCSSGNAETFEHIHISTISRVMLGSKKLPQNKHRTFSEESASMSKCYIYILKHFSVSELSNTHLFPSLDLRFRSDALYICI